MRHFPVFNYSRTVNLLFKQDALVNDWLSQQINHPSVRIGMTALSLVDCSSIHPQVMLLTLRYFKGIAARLFLRECHDYAIRHDWFNPANNSVSVMVKHEDGETTYIAPPVKVPITHSMLYIEEYLKLLSYKSIDNRR